MSEASLLVADDHDSLRLLMRTMLSRTHGWSVVEAVDGDEALRLALDGAFDAVILDQRMPA